MKCVHINELDLNSILEKTQLVDEEKSVEFAIKKMKLSDISHVIVTSEKKPKGMITVKDIMIRVILKNLEPSKTILKNITSHPLIMVEENTLLKDVLHLMLSNKIRRLPITQNDKIIGIITFMSLIRNPLIKNKIGEALCNVPKIQKFTCPYCQSKFKEENELNEHIRTTCINTA
ncbi:MAG: cyclic nucleotide-binding/CBS domain-containing protein [Nitrososphaeraceae archaeon]